MRRILKTKYFLIVSFTGFGMITRNRSLATAAFKVVNNVARQQFVISTPGADEATLTYEQQGKQIKFLKTNVPDAYQGKGVGKILAKNAFDHALKNKLDVTIECHFLEHFYQKNLGQYKSLKVKIDLKDN